MCEGISKCAREYSFFVCIPTQFINPLNNPLKSCVKYLEGSKSVSHFSKVILLLLCRIFMLYHSFMLYCTNVVSKYDPTRQFVSDCIWKIVNFSFPFQNQFLFYAHEPPESITIIIGFFKRIKMFIKNVLVAPIKK